MEYADVRSGKLLCSVNIGRWEEARQTMSEMPSRTGGGLQTLRAPAPGQFRAGGRVLALFTAPLNGLIVQALAKENLRLGDLQARVGCPAQTTLRGHLDDLIGIGVVTKLERRGMPYAVTHELTPAGREILFVVETLEAWLAGAPQGEVLVGTDPAKAAVKALAAGWGSGISRALGGRPRSLTELDKVIVDFSYPALERRLSTMRITGQIEPAPSQGGKGTPYAVTDWGRRGIAPLSAAGRWERTHLPAETEPITWVEVEAAFLLSLPLVDLPKAAAGECVLAVDTKEAERRIAGVHIAIEAGTIVYCDPELKAKPPTFALGPAEAWLNAVIDGKVDDLHIRGDKRFVSSLVKGLHKALFGGG